MLVFAKLSPKSFVYDFIDTFCFPNPRISKIYTKNDIKCYLYLN